MVLPLLLVKPMIGQTADELTEPMRVGLQVEQCQQVVPFTDVMYYVSGGCARRMGTTYMPHGGCLRATLGANSPQALACHGLLAPLIK